MTVSHHAGSCGGRLRAQFNCACVEASGTDKAHSETAGGTAVLAEAVPSSAGDPRYEPSSTTGPCPRCGLPVLGRIGGTEGRDVFVRAAHCGSCGWEAPPIAEVEYPKAGEQRRFVLEQDGSITVYDEATGAELDRADMYASAWYDYSDPFESMGISAQSVRRGVEAHQDARIPLGDLCDAAGLYSTTDLYGVILDRDALPPGALVARSVEDIYDDYDNHFGPALDQIMNRVGGEFRDQPPLLDESRQHIGVMCMDADLPAMEAAYEILNQRGALSDAAARSLTADDVRADYEQHIGPAIDAVQAKIGTVQASAAVQRISRQLGHALSPLAERVDVQNFVDSVEDAYFAFTQSPKQAVDLADFGERLHALRTGNLASYAPTDPRSDVETDHAYSIADRRVALLVDEARMVSKALKHDCGCRWEDAGGGMQTYRYCSTHYVASLG